MRPPSTLAEVAEKTDLVIRHLNALSRDMPLATRKMLVCDRCGESLEVPEAAAESDVASGHPGWLRVRGDAFLCPRCSPGYETLAARHRVELEDYIDGADLR